MLFRSKLIATEIDHGLRVEVADGQHMINKLCCQDARIKFSDDCEFASDLLALDMGPIDAVLGYDWLQSSSKISMDFGLVTQLCPQGSLDHNGVAASKLQVISARQLAKEV